MIGLVDEGRYQARSDAQLPPLTAEGIGDGVGS
jgi:hypothetical protein